VNSRESDLEEEQLMCPLHDGRFCTYCALAAGAASVTLLRALDMKRGSTLTTFLLVKNHALPHRPIARL
jgi:hypothetical protein